MCRSKYFLITVLFFISGVAQALPFSIVPASPLPTLLPVHGSVTARYTITNTTKLNPPSNMVKWLPPNVTVKRSGTTCTPANAFRLQPGQSCNLNLTITGPVDANDPNTHNHLMICMSDGATCAGPMPANALNVALDTAAKKQIAYIANNDASKSVSICNVAANGRLTGCIAHHDASFDYPIDIVTNETNTLAYVANSNNDTISICNLGNDGSLGTCSVYTPLGDSLLFTGLTMHDNTLYFTQYLNDQVTKCSLAYNGYISSCTNLNDVIFDGSSGRIAFSPDDNYVYVPNFTPLLGICPVNPDGTFAACTGYADAALFDPIGIALNTAGTMVYAANDNSTVTACHLISGGAVLGTCTSLDGNLTFMFSTAENAIAQNSNNFAYFPNQVQGNPSSLSICPYQPDGSFGTCVVQTNNTLGNSSSITFINVNA